MRAIDKITGICIVMGIVTMTAISCSCGRGDISSSECPVSVTPISHESLPKLDYSRTVGYATFEGIFCKVLYQNGAFSFLTFDGSPIWPKRFSTQPAACWNEVRAIIHSNVTESKKIELKISFGPSEKKEEKRNAENKSSFEKAFIGSFCWPSTKETCQIIQNWDEITFSQYGNFLFSSSYDFNRELSSPILFHGRMIRVAMQEKHILFQDAQTGSTIDRSEYTSGRLHAVGILGKGNNDFLVVIKTLASYKNESEIWIFDQTFKKIYSKEIHGRHWKLVTKEADPDTLFAYRQDCDIEITEGFKITRKIQEIK